MDAGLRINYGDHVMDISANTRIMSFISRWTTDQKNTTATFPMRPGASLVVLPVKTFSEIPNDAPVTVKYYMKLSGISVSGNTVSLSVSGVSSNASAVSGAFVVDVYQVDGVAPPGSVGVFMQNSTNVMSITDAGQVSQCIIRQSVRIDGSYSLGIPSDSAVFCRWDSTGRLFLDRETMTLYAYGTGDYSSGVIDVQIVAFRNQPALPHNGGLNIYKGDGSGTLVFSTEKPPLIFSDAYYTLPTGRFDAYVNTNVPLSKPMVCMCPVGVGTGAAAQNGGYYEIFDAGLRMTGGMVAAHICKPSNKRNYGGLDPVISQSRIPAIDAEKYFSY